MAVPLKPRTPAIDLAEHDIVEDDCDLVVGPLASRASTDSVTTAPQAPLGRQLGGSSFKDNSILGSAALAAKLSQPTPPGPAAALLARRPSSRDVGHCIYGGGNPIIATAAPSRPTSAAPRQPRNSAPSGSGTDSVAAGPPAAADGGVSRMEGDINGGDSDSNSPPKASRSLLRRLSSGRIRLDGGSNPKPKPAAVAEPTPRAKSPPPCGTDAVGGAQLGPSENRVPGKGAALPCVDVEPERRQRLLRDLSLNERQGAAATTVVLPAAQLKPAGAAGPRSQDAEGCAGPLDSDTKAAASGAKSKPGRAEVVDSAPAAESSTGPLRTLARMISGAVVTPSSHPDPQKPQKQEECSGRSKERRTSIGGLRELFSRPSSARRTSEAGGPQPPTSSRQQQQQGQAGARNGGEVVADGVTRASAGGGRPANGFLKRTASSLPLAWAH